VGADAQEGPLAQSVVTSARQRPAAAVGRRRVVACAGQRIGGHTWLSRRIPFCFDVRREL